MLTPAHPDTGDERCASIRAEVFAACDGELSAAALAEIDAHLHHCIACRSAVTADAVFHRVVRQAVTLDAAPQSLRDRVAVLLHSRTTEIAPA
ncbi:MAG: hypothetical protein U5K74_08000 [Gemmatimonadaceae bacterium]|nr:hypothetical protein [Gemmatimonadaceae bacterium]